MPDDTLETTDYAFEPRTLELESPVDLGSKIFATVEFKREAVGKDFLGLPGNPSIWLNDQLMIFASRLTGLSPVVFQKMKGRDWKRVVDVLLDFI